MRFWIPALWLLSGIYSCGVESINEHRDSVITVQLPPASLPDQSQAEYARLLGVLEPLPFPTLVDVDSVRNYVVELTHVQAQLLFPPDFGLPDDVSVQAFAKHTPDSTTNAIWYRMQKTGTENKDIWIVLYNDTAGPLAVRCPATKGDDYAFAKIMSPDSLREIYIDRGEKTIVTTRTVVIQNGRFVPSDEVTSSFGPGNGADAKVQAAMESFRK